jgi:hypothetical protein
MHDQSYLDILAETKNGYVSRCNCCGEFNLTYKNVLLVQEEEALFRFFEWVIAYRSSRENYQPLPHGRDRVYSSPHSNLYLVYNDRELDELEELFAGVQLVLEARRIATVNRPSSKDN